MAPTTHLKEGDCTIGSSALLNHGLRLHCLDCGRCVSLSPSQLATLEPSSRTLWDFKRRRRCAGCGARGSTDRIEIRIQVMTAGIASWRAEPDPTLPQLWGR
jgi:hypothetical protein